jgi:hypothetical protein
LRDIRRLLPPSLPRGKRFETSSDVAERKRKLVEALQDIEPELADAYNNCTRESRCSIPGCPSCSRWHRGYRFSETARINELPLPGPRYYVTVYLATIPEVELPQVRICDEHKKIRKRMERLGFQGVLIGGTEGAWDAKQRAWILHLHILSIGIERAKWEALAVGMGSTDRAIPIKIERLKDTVRPLSYMQKWMTYFRPHRRLGRKLSMAVPLKPQQVAKLCRWWASHRFEEFMFLYGAKRRGGRIVPNTRVPEVGPVGTVGISRLLFSRTFCVESTYRGHTIRFTVRDELAVPDQIAAFGKGANSVKQEVPPTIPTKPTKISSAHTK